MDRGNVSDGESVKMFYRSVFLTFRLLPSHDGRRTQYQKNVFSKPANPFNVRDVIGLKQVSEIMQVSAITFLSTQQVTEFLGRISSTTVIKSHVQGSRIRFALGCVIPCAGAVARSRNLGQALFGSPV